MTNLQGLQEATVYHSDTRLHQEHITDTRDIVPLKEGTTLVSNTHGKARDFLNNVSQFLLQRTEHHPSQ